MQNIKTPVTFTVALTIDLRKFDGGHPDNEREQAFLRTSNKMIYPKRAK